MLAHVFDTKEEKDLVSILFMTYNHEAYVEDALKGLLAQEYPRMELIVLDDASGDNTVGIIESYMGKLEEKFDRIVKIYHESNTGNVSKNQNELVINAHGEYIVGLSGDDAYMDGAIEKMVKILQQHRDCGMAYANMQMVETGWHYGDSFSGKLWENKLEDGIQNHMFERLMWGNFIAAPATIIKREMYEKYGLHDESIIYEDHEYWLRISRTEKIYYSNMPVVVYRFGTNSISNHEIDLTNKRLEKSMNVDYLVRKKYIKYLPIDLQTKCWEGFFEYYMKQCLKKSYADGVSKLKELMRIHEVILGKRNSEEQLRKRKLERENVVVLWEKFKNKKETFNKWLNYNCIKSVAIYGYAGLGRRLYKELKEEDINVCYVIDKLGNMLNTNIEVKTLNDKLVPVDAVIVTVIGLSETDLNEIERCTQSRLIHISEIFA